MIPAESVTVRQAVEKYLGGEIAAVQRPETAPRRGPCRPGRPAPVGAVAVAVAWDAEDSSLHPECSPARVRGSARPADAPYPWEAKRRENARIAARI